MINSPHNETPEQFVQQMGVLFSAALNRNGQAADHSLIDFGEYLVAARKQLNLSHREFAQLIDSTEVRLHALECGLLPRTEIGERLLQRIGTVVDEDREVLALILGGITLPQPTSSVVAALQPRCEAGSNYHRRRSQWFVNGHRRILQVGNQFCLPVIGFIALLYGHYHNLLDCLQASRLEIGKIVPNAMVTMAYACCFALLWLGATAGIPLLRTGSQRGVDWTTTTQSTTVLTVNKQPATDAMRSPAVAIQAGINRAGVSPIETEQFAARDPRVDQSKSNPTQMPYRIIYSDHADRNATRYIAVNDQQLALIQFNKRVPKSPWRCVSNGKFDLCPI